jgi:hypothetical protein
MKNEKLEDEVKGNGVCEEKGRSVEHESMVLVFPLWISLSALVSRCHFGHNFDARQGFSRPKICTGHTPGREGQQPMGIADVRRGCISARFSRISKIPLSAGIPRPSRAASVEQNDRRKKKSRTKTLN